MFRAISTGLFRQRAASAVQAHPRPPSEEEWSALCRLQVFPYVLRCLGQAQDAEDVTAETLAAVLRQQARFRPEVEPRLWVLGIARHKVADALRRRARRVPTTSTCQDHEGAEEMWDLPAAANDEPEAAALRAEAMSELRALVWQLPDLQREALLLQTVEGLSIIQVAQVMDRSPSSVNSLLGRARDTIRRRGAKYFGGEA